MSAGELPRIELKKYAETIRKVFDIEEEEEIDYSRIETLSSEIDRRRELFKYFIPNVFVPGKYDRRADIIDGCIYYLELLEKAGYQANVLNLWIKRLNIKRRFNEDDIEVDMYGYPFYHPIWHVLGSMNEPGLFIPRIVKYLQSFRGKKRKLDINDYSLIFYSIFYSVPQKKIRSKMLRFLRLLQKQIEKRPMRDGIKLRDFMKEKGFGDVRTFLAEYNKLGVGIYSIYDRGVFGLNQYLFQCPFPFHVKIKSNIFPIHQDFLIGGKDFIQEIYALIPSTADWRELYQKFPSKTSCFRVYYLNTPYQSLFTHFDSSTQRWRIPWDSIKNEWKLAIKGLQKSDDLLNNPLKTLPQTYDLLRVCNLLETNSNYRNKAIYRKTKIPIEKIERIRVKLDTVALRMRTLFLFHSNVTDYTILTLPGKELWKLQLLKKLGGAAIYHSIVLLEDLINNSYIFRANYLLNPSNGLQFLKTIVKIFQNHFDFVVYKAFVRGRYQMFWVEKFFDPEKECWIWDSEGYKIIPQQRARKQGYFKS
ncbi:MAG: hypothetical protein ACTSRS_18775 [Candidatus Helarchaeota archaeon]